MIKKRALGLFALLLVISVVALSFSVSASDVCCEKTTSGAWCQFEDQSNCDLNGWTLAPTSCDSTTFCQKGTCVNEQAGTCTSNTAKGTCENQGGTWYLGDKDDLPACKIGCCIAGEEVAFVNPTECQQIASDNGVNVDFRDDITSLQQCLGLSTGREKGACVLDNSNTGTSSENWFSNLFGGTSNNETPSGLKNCIITTQSDCISQGGSFNEGLLCTAPGLSNCAKSKNTKCENEKVYFLDTCGNLANVYDSNMYSDSDSGWDAAMTNYWTNIQDPICSVNNVNNKGDASCGDCNYGTGTVCAKYNSGDEGMPQAPAFGDNVCRDLGCYYKGQYYHHTESWCAETPGTYPHVPLFMDDKTKDELRNASKYNLPGSRYVKLQCYDGEVIPEECKDYRNGICKESTVNGFTHAQCVGNAAITCFDKSTKTDCEKEDDCKWIAGYRRDRKKISIKNGLKEINDKQGSCYPLFSPGIEFWNKSGEDICASNTVIEYPLYEIGILHSRKKFAESDFQDKANKCLDNCYAIPSYGTGNTEELLKSFQLTTTDGSRINNDNISRREGYYCLKDINKEDTLDNAKTGSEATGNGIDCASGDNKDINRRRTKPVYTNQAWLNMIRDRTRSTGDCGYKTHAFYDMTNYLGDKNSEIIKVIFQKLSQKMDVKENITESEIIYKGNDIEPKDYTNTD